MKPIQLAYNPAGLRVATTDEASFVVDLQKKHSEALGFLPRAAISAYLEAGRVLLGKQNDQHAGYILGRPQMRYDNSIAPITQCAVAMDAARRKLGLGMVDAWATAAFLDGKKIVQCWCADDLDAASFWPAVGFTAIARRYPVNQRQRSLTLWRRPASADATPAGFMTLPPLAGFRASKVGRIEHLHTGVITNTAADPAQFMFDVLLDDGRLFACPY